jgi:hypothetical protein
MLDEIKLRAHARPLENDDRRTTPIDIDLTMNLTRRTMMATAVLVSTPAE